MFWLLFPTPQNSPSYSSKIFQASTPITYTENLFYTTDISDGLQDIFLEGEIIMP